MLTIKIGIHILIRNLREILVPIMHIKQFYLNGFYISDVPVSSKRMAGQLVCFEDNNFECHNHRCIQILLKVRTKRLRIPIKSI